MQADPIRRHNALVLGQMIDDLSAIVPPPGKPLLGERTWEWLFAELGTDLPFEYVTLMETYGAGTWSDWLEFFAPLRDDGLVRQARDGFLPFARTRDGRRFGWLTSGAVHDSAVPDSWPLAFDRGHPHSDVLTGVLLRWARGNAVPGMFPAFTAPSFVRAVPVDWAAVEQWLGLRLPSDYKTVIDERGPHVLGGVVSVEAPCVRPGFDFRTWITGTGLKHRRAVVDGPSGPQPGRGAADLLPFGSTPGGHLLFWHTRRSADPDEWTTVVSTRSETKGHQDPHQDFPLNATGLLDLVVRNGAVPLPSSEVLGPLLGTVTRIDADPWTPPEDSA